MQAREPSGDVVIEMLLSFTSSQAIQSDLLFFFKMLNRQNGEQLTNVFVLFGHCVYFLV